MHGALVEKVHTVQGNRSDLQCGERRGWSLVAGVTTETKEGASYVCSLRTYMGHRLRWLSQPLSGDAVLGRP